MFDLLENFWSWVVDGKLVQSVWLHHPDDNEVRDLLLETRRSVDFDVPISISAGEDVTCEFDSGEVNYELEPSSFIMIHMYETGLRFWAKQFQVTSYRLAAEGE